MEIRATRYVAAVRDCADILQWLKDTGLATAFEEMTMGNMPTKLSVSIAADEDITWIELVPPQKFDVEARKALATKTTKLYVGQKVVCEHLLANKDLNPNVAAGEAVCKGPVTMHVCDDCTADLKSKHIAFQKLPWPALLKD